MIREIVMFVLVRAALEVRSEEADARPAVATGLGRGVILREVKVVVEMKFEEVRDVRMVVVVIVGSIVRREVMVVEFGGWNEHPE